MTTMFPPAVADAFARRDLGFRLGAHFTLGELLHSDTAAQHGIDNFPGDEAVIASLAALVINVLEPLRAGIGAAVKINSGYRCAALNHLVCGVADSQHLTGQAADIDAAGIDNHALAVWIDQHLVVDQVILEGHRQDAPGSGWVHVSWRSSPPCRRQALTMRRGAYLPGLLA